MARKQPCGGELRCKSIGNLALYTIEDGEKVYEHRCGECGMVTDQSTIGGTSSPARGSTRWR